jgi:glycosyltransferase involved in cell wall biosynthesis
MKVAMLNIPIVVVDPQKCGGVERMALQELEYLRRDGIYARYYVRGFTSSDPNIEAMPSFRFGTDMGRQYYAWFVERSKDADIQHSLNAPLLALISDKPRVLIHVHNVTRLPYYEVASKKYNRCLFACCSSFIYEEFIKNNPDVPPDRVISLPNGIDTGRFKPAGKAASNELPRILFTGAWIKQKGISFLLDALKLLEGRGLRFEAAISGSSYLYDTGDVQKWQVESDGAVREAVGRIKSARILNVTKYGDMPDLYRSSDIYVFPSVWPEPFGLGIIEAMSCGIPVVACSVGGVPEIVDHGKSGLLVPSGDVPAMADALERLINDEPERRRLGVNGRKRVEENFSIDLHMGRLIKVYERLMSEPG